MQLSVITILTRIFCAWPFKQSASEHSGHTYIEDSDRIDQPVIGSECLY